MTVQKAAHEPRSTLPEPAEKTGKERRGIGVPRTIWAMVEGGIRGLTI